MSTKVTFTTGNFDLEIEGDLKAEVQAQILQNGLNWIVQRDVASGIYKEIAGVGDKKTLPEGFKRNSVEFSKDNAQLIQEAAETQLAKYLNNATVAVVEHVASEQAASPMVRATTFVETLLGTAHEGSLRAMLGLGKDATKEQLVEKANTMGLGIQAPRKAKNAEAAA